MKSFILASILLAAISSVLLLSFTASSVAAVATCHNATGSCTQTHFVCANEELVPHAKRCDGVEDCADGTDEYMCEQEHLREKSIHDLSVAERIAETEVACLKCTCLKGTITVASTNTAWWKIATTSPRDNRLLTSAPNKQNKPCNPIYTSEIILNVYKKKNSGCRGWICCFRQEQCKTCSSYATADNCWP